MFVHFGDDGGAIHCAHLWIRVCVAGVDAWFAAHGGAGTRCAESGGAGTTTNSGIHGDIRFRVGDSDWHRGV